MAYNNYFPQNFNPYPYQFQQQTQQPMQIQNGGFISVRNIEEALNYPVAPGNSITFKDENSPYVYTKTKGFSQLDQPVFEKYRLVKEDAQETPKQPKKECDCDGQIKLLWDEINALKAQINALNGTDTKEDADSE